MVTYLILRLCSNGLWSASAFTSDKRGQRCVTTSWHRTRSQAVSALSWFFEV